MKNRMRRPYWVPPSQDHVPAAPPPAGPTRVQVSMDPEIFNRIEDLRQGFWNLEEAIQQLSLNIQRLERDFEDLKEMIGESGGSAAAAGGRGQSPGAAGA